jgi:hypothetical protein
MIKQILKAGPNQMETLRRLRTEAAAIDKDVTVRLVIVDVTRDQNVRSAMRARQYTKALDRCEARLPQRFLPAAELLEDLADLPICRMYEAHAPSHHNGRLMPDAFATYRAAWNLPRRRQSVDSVLVLELIRANRPNPNNKGSD